MEIISNYLTTGFKSLDETIRGWITPSLNVVASRPSMGKTSFILSMVRKIAIDQNIPSVLISTEMSGTALTKRLIANICNITGEALLTGRLTRDEWDYYRQQSSVISACPLYIFDTSYLTLGQVRMEITRLVRLKGVKIVFFDRLDNINTEKDEYERVVISKVCKELRKIAEQLGIAIVGTVPLVRGKNDWNPGYKDFLNPVSEEDVSRVLFLYRPDVDRDEWKEFSHNGNLHNNVLVRVSRPMERNTDLVLKFTPEYHRFEDFDNEHEKKQFINTLNMKTDLL